MSELSDSTVSLDSFVNQEVPIKFPALRRLDIIRLRGTVVDIEDQGRYRLVWLGGVDKPVACTKPLAVPPIGEVVDFIATESAVWYFAKWWSPVERSHYSLHAKGILKTMVLEILAGVPDERFTADDLHTSEMEATVNAIAKAKGKEKGDLRVFGAILASLWKNDQIIAPVPFERIRSRRRICHNRPDLKLWTWWFNAHKETQET